MIEVGDGVRDARQKERLRGEDADVRDEPALAHHGDLQHQDKRRHQRDHSVTELWVVQAAWSYSEQERGNQRQGAQDE